MTEGILRFLYWSGLPQVLRFYFRRKVLVLAYHGFRRQEAAGNFTPFWGPHVTAAKFEEQLGYLKKHYAPVSLAVALEALRGGQTLPDHAVVLTIDDGYRSVYEIAYPLLQKYGIPATVFLTTGYVDGEFMLWVDRLVYAVLETVEEELEFELDGQPLHYDLHGAAARQRCVRDLNARLKGVAQEHRDGVLAKIEKSLGCQLTPGTDMPEPVRPLSWDQVRQMQDSGLVTFGSHTRTHAILSRCSADFCRREIRDSRDRLEEELKIPCRLFAYPNGGLGDFNETSRRILAEEGFRCALVSIPGLAALGDELLTLKRVPVLNWMGKPAFALQIVLVVSALRRLKTRWAAGAGKV